MLPFLPFWQREPLLTSLFTVDLIVLDRLIGTLYCFGNITVHSCTGILYIDGWKMEINRFTNYIPCIWNSSSYINHVLGFLCYKSHIRTMNWMSDLYEFIPPQSSMSYNVDLLKIERSELGGLGACPHKIKR